MRECNKGVKVLKEHTNNVTKIKVELTQKMTVAGNIIHCVVVTDTLTGIHKRIYVHNSIYCAYRRYKNAFV